jgi:hypothetical protein
MAAPDVEVTPALHTAIRHRRFTNSVTLWQGSVDSNRTIKALGQAEHGPKAPDPNVPPAL